MSDRGDLLDVPAAAQRLGVTQRWVRRAVAERRISFVKVGRNVRFEPEAISRYIERQRQPARDGAA
ncbi:MAG TPA: helix-turn-helix domain-containing protein [Egibacteraceae bacterium]|nr:helix-turn-helix domain-containing protein [Egibacteraceae bacterium]